MTRTRWLTLGLMLLPACGGAMGMDRGPIEVVETPPPPPAEVVVDAPIQEVLTRRPQLPREVRIGVVFRTAPNGEWRWTFEERQQIVSAADGLAHVTMFPISQRLATGHDLMQSRVVAAQHGAHAVLIVEGAAEEETRDNGWVATYPLLLPILFAPGQELDLLFTTDARLYDVRNGFMYAAAESEALEEQQRAHVWIDGEAATREARRRAVELLTGELTERLEAILGHRPGADEPDAYEAGSGEAGANEAGANEAGGAEDHAGESAAGDVTGTSAGAVDEARPDEGSVPTSAL